MRFLNKAKIILKSPKKHYPIFWNDFSQTYKQRMSDLQLFKLSGKGLK